MVHIAAALVCIMVITAANASAQERRPAALVPLYLANVTLHGLDVHSTMRSLAAGNREANPLLNGLPIEGVIGIKLAAAAGSVWLTERLWKRHRWTAVTVMIASNVAMTAVVANNYRLAGRSARGRAGDP